MEFEWIYGIQPVLQVLRAHRRKAKELLLYRTQEKTEIQEVIALARKQGVMVRILEKNSFPVLPTGVLHQGLALKTASYSYLPIEDLYSHCKKSPQSLLLILDQIQDPQNLGAILRTAHCAGVNGVILPERGGALLNPTVMKASAGAAEWLSIYLVKNIARTLEELKEISMWIYGAEGAAQKSYDEEKYPFKTALVMGSEGKGLRHLIKEKCDLLISIPLLGRISSLNVSVATGVLLYEVLRQRKNKAKSP